MPSETQSLTRLIREVRTCFNQLKHIAELTTEGLDINPSMRAVLEGLNHPEPRTVPDLAKEKGVSRQHVQTVMNALLEKNYVEPEDNPNHKRSVLYRLTPSGRETFEKIQRRETAPMTALAAALPEQDIEAGITTLLRMNKEINKLITHGENL